MRLLLDALAAHAPGVEIAVLAPNQRNAPLRTVLDRVWWEQVRLPYAAWREHRRRSCSALITSALGAPLLSPVPVLAIVNDLIPLEYPVQFNGAAGWYWKQLLPFSWRRCAGIIVSNASLVEPVAQRLEYPSSRIHVVPYYANPAYKLIADGIQHGWELAHTSTPPARPCFVMLSTHEPRKNIELAIRALGTLRKQGTDARLICVGGVTAHTNKLRQLAGVEGVGDSVEFPGYQTPERIVALLLACTALLFVSCYEGYGLPPQEAQSIGCAVVLSDIACHRSVYEDQQRWEAVAPELRQPPAFVAVDDVHGLARQMRLLQEDADYRQRQRLAGMAYQSTFGPEKTARALLSAIESVTACYS